MACYLHKKNTSSKRRDVALTTPTKWQGLASPVWDKLALYLVRPLLQQPQEDTTSCKKNVPQHPLAASEFGGKQSDKFVCGIRNVLQATWCGLKNLLVSWKKKKKKKLHFCEQLRKFKYGLCIRWCWVVFLSVTMVIMKCLFSKAHLILGICLIRGHVRLLLSNS